MTAQAHLLVDLRTAQVFRERGIPRYIQGLILALAARHPHFKYSWLVEAGTGEPGGAAQPLYAARLAACGTWVNPAQIAALPRVTHYLQACLFDRGRSTSVLFPPGLAVHQPRLSAIFYDLIPWVYPEQYLAHPAAALAYERGLHLMRQLPRLFSISECSRIDAIAAGCEPDRITTIYGGWDDDRFNAPEAAPLPLPEHYWLYIGGADPRKNMAKLFVAWAQLHQVWAEAKLNKAPPVLVVVCSLQPEDRAQLEAQARQAALPKSAYLLTGHVADGAMPAIISQCEGLIFPSLYEGLGLPVLEAYQYDRPALVSDSSSLRELSPPECRFDPTSPASMAASVLAYYRDPRIAQASRQFAPEALALCRWPRAADQVAQWLGEPAEQALTPRPGLVVVSTLPPDESGIATYTQIALGSTPWRTTFFAPWGDQRLTQCQEALGRHRHALRSTTVPAGVLPAHTYRPLPGQPTLWVLGNSEHHFSTLRALLQLGRAQDWLYLHEAELGGLLHHWAQEPDAAGLSPALAAWPGNPKKPPALAALLAAVAPRNIIVNSAYAAQHLLTLVPAELAGQLRIEVGFLPLPAPYLPPAAPVVLDAQTPLRVMHVGILGKNKQPEQLVAACEHLLASGALPGGLELTFAGFAVQAYLTHFKLQRPWIKTLEAPSTHDLRSAMLAAHVGVQPRWPQHGESSGAVADWLALGKPLVATQAAGFADLAGAIHGVPPEVSPQTLGQTLLNAATQGPPEALAAWRTLHGVAAWQQWLGQLLQLV
jgi:glycosyltransferase involved in cell wall biosynthesis